METTNDLRSVCLYGLLSSLLVFTFACFTSAQPLVVPPVSAPATLHQTIGLTNTTITYHRPHVKGRLVFGNLVPYGQVWRTGANASTLIHIDQPFLLDEQELAAGTYSLFTIPGSEKWNWILNKDTTLWGARGYDPAQDVIRIAVTVIPLSKRVETMHLFWEDITYQSAKLVLEWDYSRVELPFKFFTDKQVAEQIGLQLNADSDPNDFYLAARYQLENDGDLAQAMAWMNIWLEKNGPQFGILRYKALIEYKNGEKRKAKATLLKSLELARKAENTHYVRMNEKTLMEWDPPVFEDLQAEEVVQNSIAYHDPLQQWYQTDISFSLYEQRPGHDYRLSHLTLGNRTGTFELEQQRGPVHIYRFTGPDTCRSAYNGQTKLTEQEKTRLRLHCTDHSNYANYYRYLWGLPMVLKDEGTIIHPTVWLQEINGNVHLKIKVSYHPEVGGDIWYFYFDPTTFALKAYQFFHDESKKDGEYILLEYEEKKMNMIIPAKRSWYTNKDHAFLGYDLLLTY